MVPFQHVNFVPYLETQRIVDCCRQTCIVSASPYTWKGKAAGEPYRGDKPETARSRHTHPATFVSCVEHTSDNSTTMKTEGRGNQMPLCPSHLVIPVQQVMKVGGEASVGLATTQ